MSSHLLVTSTITTSIYISLAILPCESGLSGLSIIFTNSLEVNLGNKWHRCFMGCMRFLSLTNNVTAPQETWFGTHCLTIYKNQLFRQTTIVLTRF